MYNYVTIHVLDFGVPKLHSSMSLYTFEDLSSPSFVFVVVSIVVGIPETFYDFWSKTIVGFVPTRVDDSIIYGNSFRAEASGALGVHLIACVCKVLSHLLYVTVVLAWYVISSIEELPRRESREVVHLMQPSPVLLLVYVCQSIDICF